jgi:transposase-like protein
MDKNAAYLPALKEPELLLVETELRQVRYLNNRIRARSQIYQEIDKPWTGIWLFQHCQKNYPRL